MTEDEANTKWCFQSSNTKGITSLVTILAVAERNQENINTVLDIVADSDDINNAEKCIGSRCMAWINEGEGAGHCGLVYDRSMIFTDTTNHY